MQGFLQDDKPSAQTLFARAAQCFKKCSNQDPTNETYKKAIEMCDKVRGCSGAEAERGFAPPLAVRPSVW